MPVNSVPVGTIVAWAGPEGQVPAGWLICNGDKIDRAVYSALFKVITDYWGPKDDATGSFTLPDLRGLFLRGVNGTRNDGYADPMDGRSRLTEDRLNEVGSLQRDGVSDHQHTFLYNGAKFTSANSDSRDVLAPAPGAEPQGVTIGTIHARQDTRPKNAYVHYIIKALD